MDAIRYIKITQRICRNNDCRHCPLWPNDHRGFIDCKQFIREYPEEAIRIIEKWAKEHATLKKELVMSTIKPYRDEVVQQIKEAGQELIDRAESIIGEGANGIADVKITIQIGMSVADDKMPEIKVETLYANRKTFDRWCKRGEHSRTTILSKGGIK